METADLRDLIKFVIVASLVVVVILFTTARAFETQLRQIGQDVVEIKQKLKDPLRRSSKGNDDDGDEEEEDDDPWAEDDEEP